MPDVHQGIGCVIGFTADMGDKVIPNIVGVDIGCGMLTIELKVNIDLPTLDSIIYREIPSRQETHKERKFKFDRLTDLHCFRDLRDTKDWKEVLEPWAAETILLNWAWITMGINGW